MQLSPVLTHGSNHSRGRSLRIASDLFLMRKLGQSTCYRRNLTEERMFIKHLASQFLAKSALRTNEMIQRIKETTQFCKRKTQDNSSIVATNGQIASGKEKNRPYESTKKCPWMLNFSYSTLLISSLCF